METENARNSVVAVKYFLIVTKYYERIVCIVYCTKCYTNLNTIIKFTAIVGIKYLTICGIKH